MTFHKFNMVDTTFITNQGTDTLENHLFAGVAQLVEQCFRKAEVASSTLASGFDRWGKACKFICF